MKCENCNLEINVTNLGDTCGYCSANCCYSCVDNHELDCDENENNQEDEDNE